ncbi:MAG TPA: hypothetical protein VGO33_14815 [Gemmatimonadaceae bacterium]|jgi:hypothetical protein|nr:hypothetical protein [Gemmatimonadaceae bacterium]
MFNASRFLPETAVRPFVVLWCVTYSLLGCATWSGLPKTPGEQASGFGYVPLDGLAIRQIPDPITCFGLDAAGKKVEYAALPLLQLLPDLSVRFAVASFTKDGGLSYGPVKFTANNGGYRAVLDYVNVDDVPVEFYIKKYVRTKDGKEKISGVLAALDSGDVVTKYEAKIRPSIYTTTVNISEQQNLLSDPLFDRVTIPVYVGIGLRVSADITALKGGVSITSLAGIAAEARANALTGTLTVQTLGLSGKSIAPVLPLPSRLDETTVENSILALGSGRTSIYSGGSAEEVTRTPRVVGLYSPIGSDPRLINVIYSELSRSSPEWVKVCRSP